jgi:hypothetical protein
MELSCYFAISSPDLISKDEAIAKTMDKFYQTTLSEIQRYKDGLIIEMGSKRVLHLKLLDKENNEAKSLEERHWTWDHCDCVLKISIELSEEEEKEHALAFPNIRNLFLKRVNDFWIALTLASGGVIHSINRGIIRIDGAVLKLGNEMIFETDKFLHPLGLHSMECLERKWPIPINIDLKQTWQWLLKFEEEIDYIGKSRIGKSINAYSHVLHHLNSLSPEHIIWASIGIETLYADGNQNLLEQLDTKSQIILGSRESYLDIFKQFYNYRSRLLHGDMDVPGANYRMDDTPEFDAYTKNIIEIGGVAVSVLFCTLQQLIDGNRTSLEFERSYNLK